jgi:transcription elongation factor GreA
MQRVAITKQGFDRLEEELKHLKTVERPKVIEQIAEAREHGDLKENAEYHAARDKQSFIEGRIQHIEGVISHAEIIDTAQIKGKKIVFGAHIKLVDVDTEKEVAYQVVGEVEADLESGRISITSPIARGLLGKEEGDEVTITTPGGKKTYEVLEVKFV